MVTEQIANLSARKCCLGSSPSLSAENTFSGCSVARLSRLLWEQEVAGSNPATPTLNGALWVLGRSPFLKHGAFFLQYIGRVAQLDRASAF